MPRSINCWRIICSTRESSSTSFMRPLLYTAMPRKLSAPVITLTSDFGLADSYVAEMKAALLRECPDARVIDITHLVPRHDVLYGSVMIERAISAFAAGAGHPAVVDAGGGSER